MLYSDRRRDHGFDCVDVCAVGHDPRQDRTDATKGENKDSYDGGGETSSAGRGRAQVLHRERLTRTESTKSGCGVVEQTEKAWNQ